MFQPTLKVAVVGEVPKPDGRIETAMWGRAPELTLTARRTYGKIKETRKVKVRAIHDGRAFSMLVSWLDDTESVDYQSYFWNQREERYELNRIPPDVCQVRWPLTPESDFKLRGDREEHYDTWVWRSGWTNYSSLADDGMLSVIPRPSDYDRTQGEGLFFPGPKPGSVYELVFRMDEGQPGSVTATPPLFYTRPHLPGVVGEVGSGSVADVAAYGLFTDKIASRPSHAFVTGGDTTPGYFFNRGNEGDYLPSFWFVEFYRLLITADKQADRQLEPDKTHRMTIAIEDHVLPGRYFVTRPVRVKFRKP